MSTLSVVLLSVQWGMIFLLAFLHLIIGAKRGLTKTLYYTIISLIITVLAIIGISFISVQAFLPAGGLIEFVEWFLPKPIDEAYRVYLVDPEQNGIFVALIDLVVKLLAFYMIYPLIKWILTTTLFKKFWTQHEHQAIIRHIEKTPAGEPIQKRIQAPSRFGGGFVGFLRGLVTGWVLVMPLIVLVGAINPVDETTLSSPRDEQQLSVSSLNQSGSVIDEWMTMFSELNQKGPGKITSQIMIQNEKAEVKLFDYLFTVQVKSPYYDPMDLALGAELHRVGHIASTVYQRGYLDDQFDIGTINYHDDYQAIEQILTLIGETKLLPMVAPTAVDFAMNFPAILDLLGFDPTENEYTADLIEQLKVIDWENEANALTLTIENILLAASIGEWLGLTEDPTALFDLSNEQLRHVGQALKSLSQLELLNATPLALEFLLTQDQISNLISWDEDPLTYLHEKLDFLYEEGFLQEDIDRLGDMIIALFAETFADFDYTSLLPLSEDFNAGVYLSEDVGAIIHLLLQEITKIETILHTIPVAVDYFVYTTNNATVEEIADEISQLFNQPDTIYREEFGNIDSIYQHLISMGLDRLFGDDELFEVIDQILLQDGNFHHARQIINLIFAESHFVGEVLELVAEPIVEQLIADEDLLDIVKNVIFENDFQYGQELVTILNLSESFYQFSSLQTMTDQLNRDAYLELVSSLANLSSSQFRTLKRELFSLQLLVASPELLLYAQDKMNLDILSIPENVSQASIELDLRMLLDLGYEVATHIKAQDLGEVELNNVNLLALLPYETVKPLLTFDSVQHQNSILLSTVVQYVKNNPIDLGSLGAIALPDGWVEADFNSSIWVNEINHIIQGILNLGETYAEANLYHFSLQNLSEISTLDDIPVSLITLLTDEDKVDHAFGRILNSTLLKFNAVHIAKQMIEDNEAIPSFTFEDDYYLTDDLNSENLSELIKVVVQLFGEVISSPSEGLGYNLEMITPTTLLTAFNEVDIQLIDRFAYQLTINNLFRNVLLDDAVHQMAYELLNNNVQIEHLAPITSGLFDFDVSLDAEGRLKVETLSEILRYGRHLNLPNHFFILSPAKQTEAIYDLINEDNLDELFSISLVHELTSNIIKLEQVRNLGEAYFNLGLDMLVNQQLNITTTYDRYYDRLFDVLVTNDGLIRVEELENYVKAFITTRDYDFNLQTLNRGRYNRISNEILTKTYLDKNLIHYVTDTFLVRALFDELLNDEVLLQSAAELINSKVIISGETVLDLTYTDLQIEARFFDEEGLDGTHLYTLFEAILKQDLEIVNRGGITLADINNLLDDREDKTKLESLYDAEIFTSLLAQIIENEQVNQVILDLANETLSTMLTARGLTYEPITADEFHLKYEYVNYEATKQTLYTMTQLNIDNLNDLTSVRRVSDVRVLLDLTDQREIVDEVVQIPLIFALYESLVINDTIANLLAEATNKLVVEPLKLPVGTIQAASFHLDEKYLNHQALADLLIAVLGVQFDVDSPFSDPSFLLELLEPVQVVGVEQNSIYHLFSSNIIHETIDKLMQSHTVRNGLASRINTIIDERQLGATFTAEMFIAPEDALDDEGRIHPREFVTFVEAATRLNIASYSDLSRVGQVDRFIDFIPTAVFDKLFDSILIHHVFDVALQSDQTRIMIANLANRSLKTNAFNPNDLIIPSALLDDQERIKKLDLMTIVESLYLTDLTNFQVQITNPRDIEVLLPLHAVEHLFTSELVQYSVTNLLQGDAAKELFAELLNRQLRAQSLSGTRFSAEDFDLPETLLNPLGYIKTDDILILVETFYNLGIDSFSSIAMNNPRDIETVIGVSGLDFLLTSELIKYTITKLTQSEQTRELLAQTLNQRLNVGGVRFSAADFLIPETLLDGSGYVKTDDILILAETFYNLGIDTFSSIPLTNPRDIEAVIDVVGLDFLLTSELIHYAITKLTQSDASREAMAQTLNQQFNANNTNFKADDFLIPENLLNESGYIKKEDILILAETFYHLGIDSFSSIPLANPRDIETIIDVSGLDFLFTSELVQYSVTKLAQNENSRNLMASTLNQLVSGRGLSGANYHADDFLIPENLLDPSGYIKTTDVLLLADTFFNLGIDSFSTIPVTNPHDIEVILSLNALDALVNDSDLYHYFIDLLIQSESTRHVLASLINQLAQNSGVDLTLTASSFTIPEEALIDSQIIRSDIVDFVSVFYRLGIDNFAQIAVQGPRDVEAIMDVALFDEMMEIAFVYHLTNKLIMGQAVKTAVASILNNQVEKQGLDLTVKAEQVKVPQNALIDGRIKKDELSQLLTIFYELNIDTFSELGQISTIGQMKTIVDEAYFALMLESEIIYYLVGYVSQTEKVRNQLASTVSRYLQNGMDLDMPLIGDDFLFDQHDVIIDNGAYEGYLKKLELTQFYHSLYIFDTDQIRGATLEVTIELLTDELLRTYAPNVMVIDEMLESHMMWTLFDRILNVDANERIEQGVLAYLSRFVANAGYGSLTFKAEDNLFKYHVSALTPEGYVKREEIVKLIMSIDQIDLADGPSIRMLTDMVDANMDGFGKDDFDRFYESMIIQSLVSNMMLNERFIEGATKEVNKRQGRFDFTPELLYIPQEVVDDGLIFETEVKQLVKTFIILDIYEPDVSYITIALFTDLLDRNDDGFEDDLDRLLSSFIIFTYIDRVMKSDSLNSMITKQANDALDKNVGAVNTSLTPDMVDGNGMFSKHEIRSLLTSIRLLDLETFGDLSDLGLIDILLLDNANDDLGTFLDSHYIRVMISRMVTSETIRTRIANAADFDVEALDLEATEKDPYGNLTKAETKQLFVALNTLAINDFNAISINNATMKDLTEAELDIVLASNYFYQVIDLKMKVELDDKVTDVSLVQDGTVYHDYIKKTEIHGLFEALAVLDLDQTDAIDADHISIRQLKDLIAIDSYILRILMSDAIVEHLDVPDVSKDVNGTMTLAELNNLITALEIILQDENATIGSLDMTTLTLTTLQFNDLLNVGFDVDPVEGSPIVKRLISEQVIDVFGNRLDPNAYRTPKDIYHAELVFLKDALFELDILEITGDLNLEAVSIANVYNIHLYDSLILNRLISDEIVLVVDDMPTDAYDDPMVRYEEVGRLFRAMLVLNEPISGLDNLDTKVLTFTTIEIMRQEESLIIDRYISNALVGEPSIVTTNALDLDGHVQTIEMTKLVAALNSIDGVDTVDEFVDFLVHTNDIFVLQPLLLTDSIILIDTVEARILELLP